MSQNGTDRLDPAEDVMTVQLFPFNLRRPSLVETATRVDRHDPSQTVANRILRSVPISHPMRIEVAPLADTPALRAQWTDLVGRSLEANGFLEPAFALGAAQHFLPGDRPMLMRLESLDEPGRLLGLFAWQRQRGAFGTFARIWCPPLVAFGTPLIDHLRSAEVLSAVRAWFCREHPDVTGLLFASVPTRGRFVALLEESAATDNLQLRHFGPHMRAVLRSGGANPLAQAGGHMKELRRQRRRLADCGTLSYRSATARADVRQAVEDFLALEASGWKGRAGTALLCDPATATFTRTMTRELASSGNCRVDSLELDGRPVAMGIVLSSRDQSWLWKIAYDEAHARLSPGAQFVRDFTARQLEDPTIRQTDSCAIPDHPMIDRLWPDRLEITDIAISLSPSRATAFQRAADAEDRRRRRRATLKRLYHAARSRMR